MNESQNPFNTNGTDRQDPPANAAPTGQVPDHPSPEDSQVTPGTNAGTDVSNVVSASDDTKPAQPQYGQMKVPEYGAMASQFPPQYNPYVYGEPEKKPQSQNQPSNQMNVQSGQGNSQMGSGYGNGMGGYQGDRGNAPYGGPGQVPGGYGSNPNNFYGQPYNNPQPYNNGPVMPGGPGTPGYRPDMHNGVDMNDPVQNPYLGHWDPMAIASVILLFLPITFLPAITGALSMWRTRKYHMKGFWVATVCMVLGVIATVFEFWLIYKGININDLSQQLLNQYGSGSGGSGNDGSVSA
ncbi:hypothetical protein OZX74_05205 [Bifidobacterium sp. ESL0798]|uniref:hypothetical protein n=1 Tax=Bifidobacterium sp. ESL0798 TaxID=2983235 RepID=UPI0023F61F46|nr:hypothetical protein [Bifidobacterium sp. ESL0798]WEV73351.1 hypothetical protein OZX74_05205 [Bifidobacterium sp. ESL0798]